MRNTKQRDAVLKTVLDSSDHPSAEMIYGRVKEIIPNISLGTVYRNLSLLTETGKIRHITVKDGGDRYDKTLRTHAHFHCSVCNEVTDIPDDILQAIEDKIEAVSGCKIIKTDILFAGICNKCAEGNRNEYVI